MVVKDKIQQYLDYKGISAYRLEADAGLSKGYWGKTKSISADVAMKISRIYGDMSIDWLFRDEGEMIKSDTHIQIINEPKAIEKKLTEQDVYLYDVSAAANLRMLFDNKQQNILGKISIPDMPKCDGAVYVTGDSMYPLLKSGDIVVYKELYDFNNVIFGEMYLVSYDFEGDEYIAVKYLNRSDKEGYIKLVSYNSHHDPKDIPLNCIRAMALVKLSIRKNTMV